MTLMRRLMLVLLSFVVLGVTLGCQPPWEKVEGRKIEVHVEDEKIVVRVHTLHALESYLLGVRHVSVAQRLDTSQGVLIPGLNTVHHVEGNMFVVKTDKSLVAGWIDGFDRVAVVLHRRGRLWEYVSNLEEFIWLVDGHPDPFLGSRKVLY